MSVPDIQMLTKIRKENFVYNPEKCEYVVSRVDGKEIFRNQKEMWFSSHEEAIEFTKRIEKRQKVTLMLTSMGSIRVKINEMSLEELRDKVDEVEIYLEDEDISQNVTLLRLIHSARAVLNAEIEKRHKQ